MGFEISKMTDAKMQSWATKCDANGDGTIDKNELSIFNQGVDSYQKGQFDEKDKVTIDGVTFSVNDIKIIRKNEKGEFDNTIVFNTGIKMEYDKQEFGSEATSGILSSGRGAFVSDLKGGKGFRMTGTHKNDYIQIFNSKFSGISGGKGEDTIRIFDSQGFANDKIGRAPIYAENIEINGTRNFSARKSFTDWKGVNDYSKEEQNLKNHEYKTGTQNDNFDIW